MGLFKNIKQGLDAARNPPSQAEIEASLVHLTPEQRARYDANMAQVEAARVESQASFEEARAISDSAVVLRGPAGRYLYGSTLSDVRSPEETERLIAERGLLGAISDMRADRKGELKTALKQSFNIAEIPQEKDPARRAEISAGERAARDEARAPYRAPQQIPIAFTRLATRGKTQLAEVVAHLQTSGLSARPDHIYGVYRVPDRISPALTTHSEEGRVVEWDIVHAPGASVAGPGPALEATSFVGRDHWVARRLGEPSVLDEEVGVGFLLAAGIGPESTVGVARISEVRTLRWAGDEDDEMRTLVQGVVAVHPPDTSGAFARLAAAAPLPLGDLSAHGVHVEILNWGEIAKVVQPKIAHPHLSPSPFPYLPVTPQELIRAYLEVVGLHPADCYSVQATFDRPRAVVQGGLLTTNLGPKQMCADGKERMRTSVGELVVIVHRDRPAYVEGRARWQAYQTEVLQAHLERGTGARAPLQMLTNDDLPRGVRTLADMADAFHEVTTFLWEKPPPHRYCWPPVTDAPGAPPLSPPPRGTTVG